MNGTTGASNDGVAANNTATRALAVSGSDMAPDLTGLPTTATVGVAYTGTILCTNSGTATASATAATCTISGLPAGVTVGACTPVPPATVAAERIDLLPRQRHADHLRRRHRHRHDRRHQR